MYSMNYEEIFHDEIFLRNVSEHEHEEEEFRFQEALRALAPKNLYKISEKWTVIIGFFKGPFKKEDK